MILLHPIPHTPTSGSAPPAFGAPVHSRPPTTAPRTTLWLLVLLLVLATCSATELSAKPEPTNRQTAAAQRLLAKWDKSLGAAENALLAGDPKKAKKRISPIFRDCLRWALSGAPVEGRLGKALVLQALAYHQLGEEREALWRWHSALAVYPKAEDWDLSRFGDAALYFRKQTSNQIDTSQAIFLEKAPTNITPPRTKHTPNPRIVPGTTWTHSGTARLQFTLVTTGRLSHPEVLSNTLPTTYLTAALASYGTWIYEPARFKGEPMPLTMLQTITVKW